VIFHPLPLNAHVEGFGLSGTFRTPFDTVLKISRAHDVPASVIKLTRTELIGPLSSCNNANKTYVEMGEY